jgi:hypothetical protein
MGKFGQKYQCSSCNTKFYDLGKSNPVCPRCGTEAKKMSGKHMSRIDVPKGAVKKESEEGLFNNPDSELDIDDNLWDNIEDMEEDLEF